MIRKGGLAALALATMLGAGPVLADATAKVAIQVDENDPQVMNLALNNASNIAAHYAELGQEVAIEIVTYGPGLHMLRADTSPVKDRIEQMAMAGAPITFAACNNTLKGMTAKEGAAPALIEEATVVPSGAVRLIELQGEGFAYIRP